MKPNASGGAARVRLVRREQIASVEDEEHLVSLLKLNDELTAKLEQYEQALLLAQHSSPQTRPRGTPGGGPQVMEANTAMTDGTEFQSPAPVCLYVCLCARAYMRKGVLCLNANAKA